MSKKALGKGIGALLGDLEDVRPGDSPGVVQVPVGSLKPNIYQPREEFPESTLDELADSIREKGVLQPLLVEREGEFYASGIIVSRSPWRKSEVSLFSVADRTYSKLRTSQEMAFMRFLLPGMKFYPHERPHHRELVERFTELIPGLSSI